MKNKTLYVHVGFHKTGTTSIQNWCNENKEFLHDNDLDYATPHCISSNHAAYALCLSPKLVNACRETSLFLGLNEQNRYNNQAEDPEHIYSTLATYIKASQCSKILISSECFLEGVDLSLLKSIIEKMQVDVKFIFYLRPQIAWINSVYSYVVMDRDLRFSGTINQLPQLSMLNYNAIIDSFIVQFGKKSIILKNYNDAISDGNELIIDFLSGLIDLEKNPIKSILGANKKDNVSFNKIEIKCLNLLWKLERLTKIRIKKIENIIFNRSLQNISSKSRFMIKNKQGLSDSNNKIFSKFPDLNKFNIDE